MLIQVKGEKIRFTKIEMLVLEQGIVNLFESFDKKTLHELTLQKNTNTCYKRLAAKHSMY